MPKMKMLTIAMVEETGEIVSIMSDVLSADDGCGDENPLDGIQLVYGPCISAAYFIDENFTESDAYAAFVKFLDCVLVA